MDWADARAHDKGCRSTAHIYHVRCERPDGSWSTECTDMSTRSFHGSEMTTAPVRLPDRAWTEVAITDTTCNPNFVAKQTTQPPGGGSGGSTEERRASTNSGAGSGGSTEEKRASTNSGAGSGGSTTTQGRTMEKTASTNSGAGSGGSTPTQPPAQPPDNPSSTPPDSAGKHMPGADTTLAARPSPPAACDTEKVTRCKTLLQDQVPWQMSPEPQYRHWQEANLDHLCHCTPDAAQTVQCFQNELYANHNSWPKAIETCRAH
jgi:hypothetical protein